MKLQCPHCKTLFQVDESEYAALLAQVKTNEFEAEVNRRLKEIDAQRRAEEKSRQLEAESRVEKQLAEKEREKDRLAAEIERLKGVVESYDNVKKAEIAALRADSNRDLNELSASKDREIDKLKATIDKDRSQHELDLAKVRNSVNEELHSKERAIVELNSRLEAQEIAARNKELELREHHSAILKAKDEEIEHYKDMKSRLSTKMLGETLEQHCQMSFDTARSLGNFAGAYFEKDNDASSGTKGDFIFRDYIDGEECISIMFEMKNEADQTATKHKNEDFFAKLDKDRNTKKCEYAVLVSTLEAESEFYNAGIVDVSFRYPKMFVIRPQFFLPIIALLSKASRKSAETVVRLRNELTEARAQSVDVTRFEERRDKFVAQFMKYVDAHKSKQADALEAIDKAIAAAEKQIDNLRKIKGLFDTGTQKLIKAGEVIENDFTIKKLTHGNPTMRAKFDEARTKDS